MKVGIDVLNLNPRIRTEIQLRFQDIQDGVQDGRQTQFSPYLDIYITYNDDFGV